MKNLLLVILIFAALPAFSQKKGKVDPTDAKIDSLVTANKSLAYALDSISKDRDLYYGVYTTLIEKAQLPDFDPALTSQVLDSIIVNRDSLQLFMIDSLSILKLNNASLQSTLDSLIAKENTNEEVIDKLKQLKDLLDSKIITQAEFDEKKKVLLEKL